MLDPQILAESKEYWHMKARDFEARAQLAEGRLVRANEANANLSDRIDALVKERDAEERRAEKAEAKLNLAVTRHTFEMNAERNWNWAEKAEQALREAQESHEEVRRVDNAHFERVERNPCLLGEDLRAWELFASAALSGFIASGYDSGLYTLASASAGVADDMMKERIERVLKGR